MFASYVVYCSSMQPVPAEENVNEMLATHGWHITEYIMKWFSHVDVMCVAVSLYLDVCDFVAARGGNNWSSKFAILVDLVVVSIRHSLQHCNVPFRETIKFASGRASLLGHELGVSETITS